MKTDARAPHDADAILWALAEGTAGLTGQAFLEATVEKLARLLEVNFVGISQIDETPPTRAHMIASWHDGQLRESFSYEVTRTPCEQTLRGQVHFIPCRLMDIYPVEEASKAESYLGIPLFDTDGSVMGHLAVFDGRPMDDNDRRMAIIRIFALRAEAELRRLRLERVLRRLATTDPLTGLANRRYFIEAAEREMERARRYVLPLSIMALDLDHFKKVNDVHGHAAGDEVLRGVCRAVTELIRHTDVFGRLGGEEFAVLLPHTDSVGGVALADRVHNSIRAMRIPARKGEIAITVSIGVATLDHIDLYAEDLMRRADDALYAAKRAGRDQTIFGAVPAGEAAGAEEAITF